MAVQRNDRALVRDIVRRPQSVPDSLCPKWEQWSRRYGPYVLSDIAGEQGESWMPLDEVDWCSVYTLGVLALSAMNGELLVEDTLTALPSFGEPANVFDTFLNQRQAQISGFSRFLERWNLSRLLGGSVSRPKASGVDHWPGEFKVLGLHLFASMGTVDDYVLLWKSNTATEAKDLLYHRLAASRGIDLVCCELLANAFEHGLSRAVLFTPEWLTRNPSVIRNLSKPSTSFWRTLKDMLGLSTVQRLSAFRDDSTLDPTLSESILSDLNRIIAGKQLLQAPWCQPDFFPALLRRLYDEAEGDGANTDEHALMVLNRCVLEWQEPSSFFMPRPFIMAKLCAPDSARHALRLHTERPHLTDHELGYYENARSEEYPLLQMVIADPGTGFAGNEELVRLFERMHTGPKPAQDALEAELIKFALRPDVSTKDHDLARLIDAWLPYFAGEDEMRSDEFMPIVHGLSEVRLFVQEMGGFWRIHSNNTIVDLRYDSRYRESRLQARHGRRVPGCLHYIMLPLVPQRAFEAPAPLEIGKNQNDHNISIIDCGEHLFPSEGGEQASPAGAKLSPDGLVAMRGKLLTMRQAHTAVLISLSAFDALAEKDLPIACAVLADAIQRCRSDMTILLCGASVNTKSHLKRFVSWQKCFVDRRILPFLSLKGWEEMVEVECGSALSSIKGDLEAVLSPSSQRVITKRECSGMGKGNPWHLLEEVAIHNSGLFSIEGEAFIGNLYFGRKVDKAQRMLLGTRSSREFMTFIHKNQAFRAEPEGFYRLGRSSLFYMHLGYLWADPVFRGLATDWLRAATAVLIQGAQASGLIQATDEFTFVPLLHPAIEMTQELLGAPEYQHRADISEIRHMSEFRWDSAPARKVAGQKVVCVLDVISTGYTLERMLYALECVAATPIGVLCMVKLGTKCSPDGKPPLFAFTEISQPEIATLERLEKRP